jgi:glycosyltransferase involved in cell wall biosynthesis
MRIAYYSHYFTPEIGAPSARIYDLAAQWLASGHQVQVATCFPNHPTGRFYPGYKPGRYMHENLAGIEVHRHWTYVTANSGFVKKTLGHLSYLPGVSLFSERHILQPDVVIGTSPTFFAAMAAASFAKRRKIPFIMEVRDLWPAIFVQLGVLRNRHLIRWLERLEMRLYQQATKVVVVTESFRQLLIKRGLPKGKVFTIPNGADIDFWGPRTASSELRRRLNLEDRFVVLYIGAHGISHALERVLDAAFESRESRKIHFLFVGEGAEKERLVRRAQELGLKNVTFLDSVAKDEVREFYALADVCLVPLKDIPLFKTFIPSKMFEIMAMARPIIGSVRGEAADILRCSGGALVVEPEDGLAIAQAVLQLYRNQNQARELGRQGREFVAAHYSRRVLAAAYIDVMKLAIAEYHSG